MVVEITTHLVDLTIPNNFHPNHNMVILAMVVGHLVVLTANHLVVGHPPTTIPYHLNQ